MSDAAPSVSITDLLAHRRWVRSLARRLASDESAADDLEQETWLAAMRHPPRDSGSPRAWLGAVLRNAARTSHRRSDRRERHETASAEQHAVVSPDDVVAEAELQAGLVRAVLELDEPYRATVLFRFFHGLTPTQIAEQSAVPVETVKTRLKRAIERLRERMDADLGDDREAWCLLVLGWRPDRTAIAAGAAGGLVMAAGVTMKWLAAAAVLVAGSLAWWTTRDTRSDAEIAAANDAVSANASGAQTPTRPRSAGDEEPVAVVAPAATSGPRVTGRVLDPDGKPVPGARVTSMPEDLERTVVLDGGPVAGMRTNTSMTSDDGAFALTFDAKSPSVQVVIDAAGLAPAMLAGVRDGNDLVVRMERGVTISGRVLDMLGNAIAGACVRVVQTSEAAELMRTATSGKAGEYRVEGLPRLAPMNGRVLRWFEVRAEGYAPLLVETKREASGPLDLVLVRGATIRARAVDAETGEPVAGAHVLLWSIEGGTQTQQRLGGGRLSGTLHQRTLGEGTTAADGTLTLSEIPSKGFHPTASHNIAPDGRQILGVVSVWGDGRALASEDVPLLRDGASADITLKLRPSASIEGIAVTADGVPVAGGKAWAKTEGFKRFAVMPDSWADPPGGRVELSADGRFRIAGVPALRSGTVVAHVTVEPFIAGAPRPAVIVDVPVRAGETVRDVRVVVPTGRVLMAQVVVEDDSGHVVPGAIVRAESFGSIHEARTGADGRAGVVVGNRPNVTTRVACKVPVSVRARGFATTVAVVDIDSDAPIESHIRIPQGRSLSGRVEDAAGCPVADATIDILAPCDVTRDDPTATPVKNHSPEMAPVRIAQVVSGADGSFVVDDLPEGRLHVEVIAGLGELDAHGRRGWRQARLDGVEAGGTPVRLVVPVQEATPTQALDVIVVDAATNAVVAKARGSATCGLSRATAREVSPGRLRFEELTAGTWTFRVSAVDHATLAIDGVVMRAESPPVPLNASLRRGATLRGSVRCGPGLLPPDAEIRLTPVASGTWRWGEQAVGSVDREGAFRVTGLSAGDYSIQVVVAGGESQDVPLVAPGGRPVVVPSDDGESHAEVAVVPGASLRVFGADPRADVEVLGAAGEVVAAWRRPAGNFRLVIPPGTWIVRQVSPGAAPIEKTVVVEPGGAANVKF